MKWLLSDSQTVEAEKMKRLGQPFDGSHTVFIWTGRLTYLGKFGLSPSCKSGRHSEKPRQHVNKLSFILVVSTDISCCIFKMNCFHVTVFSNMTSFQTDINTQNGSSRYELSD